MEKEIYPISSEAQTVRIMVIGHGNRYGNAVPSLVLPSRLLHRSTREAKRLECECETPVGR